MKKQKRYILTGYAHPSCKTYKPKRNIKKIGVLFGLFGISFVIPFMTTVITISLKIITKYYPLWLYQ